MITENSWKDIISDPKRQKHFILKMDISGSERRFATDTLSVIDVTSSYKTGTVTATNLSTSLSFSGSSLLGNVFDGNFFRITSAANARFYKIKNPSTDTALTLYESYEEATVTGVTFEIITDYVFKKFLAGLFFRGEITTSINLDSMASEISSLSLSIDGSHRLQDLKSPCSNATAELGLWAEGQTYQDRLQLGEGVIRRISWGEDETPFSFQLVDLRKNLDRKFPANKITSTNFALASSSVIGNSYPVLYGSVVESPCYYLGQVDTDHRWLVAGHDINAISTAYHDGASFSPSDSGTAVDSDGNTYFFIESATDYSAQKVTVDANGTKDGSSYFSTGGEVIEDIITDYTGLTSGQIFTELFGTAKAKLSNWILSSIFNGFGKSEGMTFETVQRRLASQLPIIPVWRDGKYGIIVIDLNNPISVIKLKKNKNIISRVGNVTETDVAKVKNSFEILYGYNPRLGQYTKYKKVDSSTSKLLNLSKDRYGLLEANVINAIDIQDDSTAERLLEFKAQLLSEVFLLVTYLCTQEASIVEEGDVVTVTDADQSWTDKYFICIFKRFTIESVKLGLREIRWTEAT
tara:strand:+ start:2585 stop:4321 length:1737 start_codon:yes stop_codon:yes gene_type:complete